MRALPTDRQRAFVLAYVSDAGRGATERAYLAAGYTPSTRNARPDAWRLLHDDKVQAAVAEESKKILRSAHPLAVKALLNLVENPDHRDHGRAIALLLGRVDPEVAKTDLAVTHRVELSADDEALEQYKAMLALGVTKEKLRDVFGGNYLPKLERMLEDRTKTIEHKESPHE
jgi:phage terminase small subunit